MLASSISDFELLSQIGRGTYANVVLALSRQDNKLYAIKILNKKHIIQRGQELHTINEKKILAQISHPFLIKLHSAFQDHKNLYLVL
jgi:serine/threonine protein kinase